MNAISGLATELAELLSPQLVAAIEARLTAIAAVAPRPEEPALLSEAAYSKRYGISRRTLQDWRQKGRVSPTFVRLGRKILYIDAVPGT